MKPKLVVVCMLLIACRFNAQGQDAVSMGSGIISKLAAFLTAHNSEKAYLQFDKPYYVAGDTIYFKAYITAGERHLLSDISGVLYVDLIDPNNKIDRSIKLQLVNGLAWGDFFLPDSLLKGNYRVRAYTQWMRNEDDAIFFERIVAAGGFEKKKIAESMLPGSSPLGKPDVQFFPEGGALVNGISSKVAFKAIGPDGKGIRISGVVVDNGNNEVCRFMSVHLGMGVFQLQPQTGERYTAKVIYADGSRDNIKLPVAEISGLVLSVNNDSLPKATVKIAANKACFAQNKDKDYTLLIYSGGVATTVTCKLDSDVITLDIAKRRLRTGVATITLFSGDGQPICERLLFAQNYDQLNIGINSDKKSYHAREKVNIGLDIKNRANFAAIGHFSISVVDENKVKVNESEENTILTDLLLKSDLKGQVEEPNYYFSNVDDEARANLDLVMLTNGYRRFAWKPLLNNGYPAMAYQPEKLLEIAGTAKMLSGRPIAKGTVSLITPFTGQPVLSELTDDQGNFRFGNLAYADTGRFILQAVNTTASNNTTLTYAGDKPAPITPLPYPQTIQTDTGAEIKAYMKNNIKQRGQLYAQELIPGKILKEIKVHGRKLAKPVIVNRYGTVDYTIRGEEIIFGGFLTDRLEGRIPGVLFVPGHIPGDVVAYKRITMRTPSPPMRVVVDGAEMPSGFSLNTFSTALIEKVEVMTNLTVGDLDTEGAILITLKHGFATSEIPSKGILPIKAIGFYTAREFYSPKYEDPDTVKATDFRTTIYWNPEITTDKNGTAKFDYYNADVSGNYRIVIEGIDEKGNLGRQVYHYKVEN